MLELQAEQEALSQPRSAGPCHKSAETSSEAPTGCKRRTQSETGDDCECVIALLNPKLRVARAADGLQWLFQSRAPSRWQNIAYCATKEGLVLRIKAHLQAHSGEKMTLSLDVLASRYCDPAAWAIIAALPDYFSKTEIP